ncbi:TIR domain-containing protein [Chryseobacterium sp.]|uniref:TIR domain-containing protein n=1 Tax=Chryseobacterium sp. TaxID=1871047 RepID=UPI0025BD97ED|nr:TIR domain-containing protein [Chryseobacterium sp.]MBV8328285.1 TIR domain-containing protein [Chryseobacterium sp.]
MEFEENIKKQLGYPESNRLKYEVLLPSNSEIARTICAFANTDGGLLILGVLSKFNKVTFTGLSDDFRVESVLDNALSKLDPKPEVESGFVFHEGKKLFAINVEKSDQGITFNNDQYEIITKKITKVLSQDLRIAPQTKKESKLSTEEKLDNVLIYLIEHPKLINVNKHTVEKVILNDGTSLSEARQLVEKLRSTNYVRSYGQNYIGVSIDTASFIASGGFSGVSSNLAIQSKKKNVFISYNWNLKDAAQKLYDFLSSAGYIVYMDDHNLGYKNKISTFMESIRASDFSILLISDKYLKSENCMTEVLHLLKEKDFHKKVLPIRDKDLKIFRTAERIHYIQYWQEQVQELEEMLSKLDQTSAIEEIKKLKNAKYIHQSINDFLVVIADMITYTIEKEESLSYSNLIGYIESN